MSLNDRDVQEALRKTASLRAGIARSLIGQEELVGGLLVGLLCGGHILLEGLPGLAKTLVVKILAQCIGGTFSRVQFTPDLLPSDIVGYQAYRAEEHCLTVQLGPIAANLVLADEINRAPAKVQSALLEAMQEKQVTIGGKTLLLPEPYMVVATQNPLEQQGTYALPEAQKDRFLLQLRVSYPSRAEELLMMQRNGGAPTARLPETCLSLTDIVWLQELVPQVHLDERLAEYILDAVVATRPGQQDNLSSLQAHAHFPADELIECGASPRATLGLQCASRALALLRGRSYVLPEDIQYLFVPILAHRIIPSFEAEAKHLTAVEIIRQLSDEMKVP